MGYPRVPDIQMPNDPALLGYIAGIVDGEGCITIRRAFDKDTSRSPLKQQIHVLNKRGVA